MSELLPDDVGVGEFLQQADLSYDAVLVHVVFVDLHHRYLPTGAVHHLKGHWCPLAAETAEVEAVIAREL